MTQPMPPGFAMPVPPSGPLPITQSDLVALEQARQAKRAERQSVAEQADPLAPSDLELRARQNAQAQQQVEEKYGAFNTALGHFSRGVLDVILAPGALLAAASESAGYLTGSDVLYEFGHDLGRAATGYEALSALGAGAEMALGDGPQGRRALTGYERTMAALKEGEQAWPMLSSLSAIAGETVAGIGTASIIGAGSLAPRTLAGVGAFEGAAGGAQTAYEKNGALRDVLTSTVVGATLGAGIVYGVSKGSELLSRRAARRQELSAALGAGDDALESAAVSVERAGGREAKSVIDDLARAREAVERAAERAGDNPSIREMARARMQEEMGERLASRAGALDVTKWAEQTPTPLQRVLYRGPLLDQVSDDLAKNAARAAGLRPAIDTALSPARLGKLLKGADGSEAIGRLQLRVSELLEQLPKTVDGDLIRQHLRAVSARLQQADVAKAMAEGHELVRAFGKAALGAEDPMTRTFASRATAGVIEDLTSDAFGDAAKAYARFVSAPSQALEALTQPKLVREALRTTELRGRLPAIMREHGAATKEAYQAAAQLTGSAPPRGLSQELASVERLAAKAEETVTLDGGPARRVVEFFKDKLEDKVVDTIAAGVGGSLGGPLGAAKAYVVSNFVRPRVRQVLQVLQRASTLAGTNAGRRAGRASGRAAGKLLPKTAILGREYGLGYAEDQAINRYADAAVASSGPASRAAGHLLTREAQQAAYKARREVLAVITKDPDGSLGEAARGVRKLTPELESPVTSAAAEKLAQLERDMPKPPQSIRGEETASYQDVKLSNAMWEATVDPLSVFDDFASGDIDYDKVQYAWKQYPGLKLAAQMGLQDILFNQLDDEERAELPENVLTQIDALFGLEGGLQPTLAPDFVQTVDTIAQQAASSQKPNARKPLALPTQQPTPMGRIAQAGS